MANVVFENVAKRYGAVSVIEGLNLEIRDEEFMVLVGPSGCGKSTALRMIAGLEEISDGDVRIGPNVVNDLPPKDRDIAMVFQTYALYPHMSVKENLEFGLRLKKTPQAEIDRLVGEAAEILGITHLLGRKPKELSGGQRQRVAVGRAIVRKPSVFLFDEPLSNLDAKLRVQMRAEISKLQTRLKTTTVYVTHDQIEAMTMGHRIAVMKDGRLQQVGTPLEVYERPVNLFVANFIGTPPMNFAEGTIIDSGSRIRTSGFDFAVPASLLALTQGNDGKAIVLGVRPENLIKTAKDGRGETIAIRGIVEIVEPIGHQVIVHAKVGGDLFVAALDAHNLPKAGDSIELNIELDAIHLFDAVTETRLTT
ncbi:MAG: sn-glycerol-3-phosphate ABC transporter ATP-binding protein UgpC [Acidobacteria bacterium]|nr:sn-glycerol-3-phosphate ABC transporter ATP-binding protein UgpC [Acidobacteriota bacterium]